MLNNIKSIIAAIVESCIYRKTTQDIRTDNKKLFVVSTGLSSKKYWEDIKFREHFAEYDLCIINDAFFRYEDEIFAIRPKYYCLFDSMYLATNGMHELSEENQVRKEIINKGLSVLEKVSWPLIVILPAGHRLKVDNSNISYIYINSVINNDESFKTRFIFYRKNMMIPCRNNVVQAALYFAIQAGYKEVGLIGAEYNFFKSVELRENGNVVMRTPHSFEEDIIFTEWTLNEEYQCREGIVSSFLKRTSETLAGYSYLREFADAENAVITNYSDGTMIEAFRFKE